jgi:hypothetical protein
MKSSVTPHGQSHLLMLDKPIVWFPLPESCKIKSASFKLSACCNFYHAKKAQIKFVSMFMIYHHVSLYLYDLFHILQSFWLTLDPGNVMYCKCEFPKGLWQWLIHYMNIILDIVHCLSCNIYTQHFGSWLYSCLQQLVVIILADSLLSIRFSFYLLWY